MTAPPQLSEAIDQFPVKYATTARFTLGSPRNIKVVDGGSTVLFFRSHPGEDPRLCLWALDVASGRERLLVDPATSTDDNGELPAAEKARRERARESAAGVVSYATDDDGTLACFAMAGSLFVVELATGQISSPEIDAGAVFDPRPAPDGTAVAFVDGNDLRLLDLAGGSTGDGGSARPTERILRSDDDPEVYHGRAEFVAAEEMGRSRGFWWSPDSQRLLVTRVDEGPVDQWWIGDPANPGRRPVAVRYPAAGTTNAIVGLELVERDGATRPVEWSDGGRFEYLADVVWVGGHQPLLVRQSRDQREVSIAELDPETLTVTERHRITDDTWVELVPGSPYPTASGLLTVEDGERARRLHLDGRPITPDQLQVRSLLGVVDGADAPAAVVRASADDPVEIHLHLVSLDGRWTLALTSGPTTCTVAVGGSTLAVTTAGPAHRRPTTTVHHLDPMVAPASGGDEQRLDSNGTAGLPDPIATIVDCSADPGFDADPGFTVLGPDRLSAALFLPSDHDGHRPLPVLLDPYGGPHAQRVLASHNPHLVSRWFAEHGYAVVVADGRGTPGRGPVWERAVAGNLADPVLDDQLAALDAVLEAHPFLDGDRVAIRGWSFGGYLAALAVLRRPDRFHAALAGAPVTTWRLYDTHYTERYLGDPTVDPTPYDRSDLWIDGPDGPSIPPLTRPLLLIHGLADDNVVSAHTLRFSTALLATGSPHRVLPLSGVTHMTPQVAVAENLLRLQLAFLDETVGIER